MTPLLRPPTDPCLLAEMTAQQTREDAVGSAGKERSASAQAIPDLTGELLRDEKGSCGSVGSGHRMAPGTERTATAPEVPATENRRRPRTGNEAQTRGSRAAAPPGQTLPKASDLRPPAPAPSAGPSPTPRRSPRAPNSRPAPRAHPHTKPLPSRTACTQAAPLPPAAPRPSAQHPTPAPAHLIPRNPASAPPEVSQRRPVTCAPPSRGARRRRVKKPAPTSRRHPA